MLDNFANIADWHPGLSASSLLIGSPATGKGARRRCDFKNDKDYILEEIKHYRHRKTMAVQIYDGNIPVSSALARFRLEALTPDGTKLSIEVDFKLKGGALGALAKPVAKTKMGSDLLKMIEANKSFAEAHGQLV